MMDPTLGTVGAVSTTAGTTSCEEVAASPRCKQPGARPSPPTTDGRHITLSKGGIMSDATLQAVHDAIAAHVSDLNAGAAEYLTEWVAIGTTAIADNPRGCMYYYIDSRIPRHHAVGLLDHGMNVLADTGCECDDGDEDEDEG